MIHPLTCQCLSGGGKSNTQSLNFKSTQKFSKTPPQPQSGRLPGGERTCSVHTHYLKKEPYTGSEAREPGG